jgi:drug/metabolite transporter (DMT)-like permease
MVWVFFGALASATGILLERIVLMKKKVSVKLYQTGQFLSLILVMLPFIPFFWKMSNEALTTENIFIFLGVIILSMLANYFTFYSMKNEKLGKLESAKITEPLFTILLAFIFSFIFGEALYHRSYSILIPAGISAFALIFFHIEKHHLKFNKYYIAALLGSFFFASELIVSRLILDFYNPITFYFLRCSAILLLSLTFLRPKFDKKLKTKTILQILLTGSIWFIYRIIVYFGYTSLGVIETTLTIMLAPVLVYFFAWKFLKNKLTWKQLTTAAIILACVAYATFF